jgi:plastocyanin
MSKRRRILMIVLLLVLGAAVLFTRSDALVRMAQVAVVEQPAEQQVVRASIRGGAFVPARIQVAAGTTVVWKNDDDVPHTVTATNRSWDSGMIQPGGTYSRKFDRAGTFSFFCVPHPNMTGAVGVRG